MFPNARYVFGAAEFDFWKRGENVREARKFNRELFVKICVPLADRSTFIKPGDEVVPGITAIDAAGHSPGLMAFHVESEGKRFMITADTCTQYVMAVQRPDWYFDMDDDKDRGGGHPQAHPRHGGDRPAVRCRASTARSPASAGSREAHGGYRWVPVSYQLNL